MAPLSIPKAPTTPDPMAGRGSGLSVKGATPKLAGADALLLGDAKARKAEVERRAQESAPRFVSQATALKLSADALESERQAELERIKNMEKGEGLTGEGTTLLSKKGSGVGQIEPKKPLPVPPAPKAIDLARQRSNEEVVREMMDLIYKEQKPQRNKLVGLGQTAADSMTFGILGEDEKDPLVQAQYAIDPLDRSEKIARGTVGVVSSFVPYGITAKMVGNVARQAGFLNKLYETNKFAYGALVENLGQELIEGGVRKGTGQEYGKAQFFQGLLLGGAFEAGLALKNVHYGDVVRQINDEVASLYKSTGKMPTQTEVIDSLWNKPIAGTDMPFALGYKENRLAYYRGGKEGRPGIDYPAEPPRPGGSDEIPTPQREVDDASQELAASAQMGKLEPLQAQSVLRRIGGDIVEGGQSVWSMAKHVASRALDSRYLERVARGRAGNEIAVKNKMSQQDAVMWKDAALPGMQTTLRAISDVDAAAFKDIAEGKIPPKTIAQAQLLRWWDGIRKDIAAKSRDYNLAIKGDDNKIRPWTPRDNYFPHIVDKKKLDEWLSSIGSLKDKSSRQKYLEYMKKTIEKKSGGEMKFNNVEEVERFLRKRAKDPVPVYGNLEKAREQDWLPDEFLKTDPREILPMYVDAAYSRLADAKHFGGRYQGLDELIERSKLEVGEQEALDIKEYADRLLGREAVEQKGAFNPRVRKAANAIRAWQIITKMSPISALKNMGDITAVFTKNEWMPTLRAMASQFSAKSRAKSGQSVITENLRSLSEDMGEMPLTQMYLKATGFSSAESFLRRTARQAGINHATVLAKNLKAEYERVGGDISKMRKPTAARLLANYVDDVEAVIRRGYLTPEEQGIAGYKNVRDIQPISREDLPYYGQSPGGRVAFQFKSFVLKRTEFIKKHIVDEARQGNVKPLMTYLVVGQAMGEGINDLAAALTGKERTGNVYERMISNMFTIGGAGIAIDFLSSMMYGTQGGGILGWIAGPAFKDMADWTQTLFSANPERIAKKAVRSIPGAGPFLTNRLFEQATTQEVNLPFVNDLLKDDTGSTRGSTRPSTTRSRPSRPSRARPSRR